MVDGSSFSRAEAHQCFILPELKQPRRDALRVLVLPDGNRRSDPVNGGYARGAHKVIESAEHLARRPDVAELVACVMSPENVAARGDAFFAELARGFADLDAAIARRGTLIAAGVRAELCGDLGPLRARGGSAVVLADAVEQVIRRTSTVAEPALRLHFGIGYGPATPREMDVDVVLRTGIEDGGALRLSGLCSHPSIANFAMTKLWPEVTMEDLDAVIEAGKRRPGPTFSMGYAPAAVVEIARALAVSGIAAPVRATLATHASARAMNDALAALYASEPVACRAVAVTCGDRLHGWGRLARHAITVLTGDEDAAAPSRGYTSMLAPGQEQPFLVLPEQRYGYATIHACAASPAGIVAGLRAATRFSATHVALFGAERSFAAAAGER
jgi:undecaprenyl pyrophosphate synthase